MQKPDLCTGTAWDNFDVNLETPSGADTIHHTYGICYQNIEDDSSTFTLPGNKRKRKQFRKVGESSAAEEIEPYWKKPKQSHFDFFLLSVYIPN